MQTSLDEIAYFQNLSKIIRNCRSFASLRCVIGLKDSRHLLHQSDAKPVGTGVATCFSALAVDWLVVVVTFAVIG